MISTTQLARLCNVSQGTVDRALHDRPGISEKTRARILKTAEQQGYLPHPAARELLTGARGTVGAVVPHFNGAFFMDLMNSIAAALSEYSIRIMMTPFRDQTAFTELLADFAARRARGIIVIPPRDRISIPGNITSTSRIVSLLSPCKGNNCFFVTPDETRTGKTATEYLLGLGHTRIAHVTFGGSRSGITHRTKGYRLAMKSARHPAIVLQGADREKLVDAVNRRGVTALFCHNDWLALSATRVLQSAGFRIPADVSIMGVDNSPTFTEIHPDLTTLSYPREAIAAAVAEIMTNDPPIIPPIPDLKILERGSTLSI